MDCNYLPFEKQTMMKGMSLVLLMVMVAFGGAGRGPGYCHRRG